MRSRCHLRLLLVPLLLLSLSPLGAWWWGRRRSRTEEADFNARMRRVFARDCGSIRPRWHHDAEELPPPPASGAALPGGGGGGEVQQDGGNQAGDPACMEWCGGFPEGVPRDRQNGVVALASFPGSGNTWCRYLLQQATGRKTGSVYFDRELKQRGFYAEGLRGPSMLVVKTHAFSEEKKAKNEIFNKAILLVRSPFDALKALFNMIHAHHVGHAQVRIYANRWKDYLSEKLDKYEDLVENTEGELKKMLGFLKHQASREVMNCVLSQRDGLFKRKHQSEDFDPYTPETHAMVLSRAQLVYGRLGLEMPPVPELPESLALDRQD